MKKIIFIVISGRGWGKGLSLSDAFKNHNKGNGKMKKGDEYGLMIFETKEFEDVWVDNLMWYSQNGARKISETKETM